MGADAASATPPPLSHRTRGVLAVAGLAVIGGLWDLVTRLELLPRFVLPAPAAVGRAFFDFSGPLLDAARVTLVEILLGFGLAVGIGLGLALCITYSRVLSAVLYPPIIVLQAVPKLAIAPLLIIWFGFGLASKVVVAFLIAFFPVVIQTTVGLRTVEPELHDLARIHRASWFRRFTRIDFPHALPYFFAALKVAITLAVTGAIVGEFVASDAGLGFLLQSAVGQHLTALAYATVAVIALVSMALFGSVVALQRVVMPWASSRSG